jgi:oligopeptide transport system ATP-binding protein
VFQDPFASLDPRMTINEIVAEPLRIHDRYRRGSTEVRTLLRLVGLNPEHGNRYAHEFSGGQRQRIGIARALALRPRVLVLDEPVSGLDVSTALVLRAVVRALAGHGRLVFYSSHELETIEKISTRVIILSEGRVVADDSAARLRELMNLASLEDVFSKLAVRQNLDDMAEALLETIES